MTALRGLTVVCVVASGSVAARPGCRRSGTIAGFPPGHSGRARLQTQSTDHTTAAATPWRPVRNGGRGAWPGRCGNVARRASGAGDRGCSLQDRLSFRPAYAVGAAEPPGLFLRGTCIAPAPLIGVAAKLGDSDPPVRDAPSPSGMSMTV